MLPFIQSSLCGIKLTFLGHRRRKTSFCWTNIFQVVTEITRPCVCKMCALAQAIAMKTWASLFCGLHLFNAALKYAPSPTLRWVKLQMHALHYSGPWTSNSAWFIFRTVALPKEEKWNRVQQPNMTRLIRSRALGLLSFMTRHQACFQVLWEDACISLLPWQGKGAQHALEGRLDTWLWNFCNQLFLFHHWCSVTKEMGRICCIHEMHFAVSVKYSRKCQKPVCLWHWC